MCDSSSVYEDLSARRSHPADANRPEKYLMPLTPGTPQSLSLNKSQVLLPEKALPRATFQSLSRLPCGMESICSPGLFRNQGFGPQGEALPQACGMQCPLSLSPPVSPQGSASAGVPVSLRLGPSAAPASSASPFDQCLRQGLGLQAPEAHSAYFSQRGLMESGGVPE